MRRPQKARSARWIPLAVVALGTLPVASTWAAGAAPKHRKQKRPVPILRSPQLWASVDACNPSDRPNTIGIRGSMPGDGRSAEQMYMRFRVQYQDPSTGGFRFVAAADSRFIAVGRGSARRRQAGRNFEFQLSLQPPPYRPHYLLRGWVDFQWRKKRQVVRTAGRVTTAGHPTGAGGDPPNTSAATCTLG